MYSSGLGPHHRLTADRRVPTMNTLYIQGLHMSEDTGLRIRVDDSLRGDFIETCKGRDTTAAQVLRGFMRWYVERHGMGMRQPSLFDEYEAKDSEDAG